MKKFVLKIFLFTTLFYCTASIPIGEKPLFSHFYKYTGKYSSIAFDYVGSTINSGTKSIIEMVWDDESSDSVSRNYSSVRKRYKKKWNLETYSEGERDELMKLLSKASPKK